MEKRVVRQWCLLLVDIVIVAIGVSDVNNDCAEAADVGEGVLTLRLDASFPPSPSSPPRCDDVVVVVVAVVSEKDVCHDVCCGANILEVASSAVVVLVMVVFVVVDVDHVSERSVVFAEVLLVLIHHVVKSWQDVLFSVIRCPQDDLWLLCSMWKILKQNDAETSLTQLVNTVAADLNLPTRVSLPYSHWSQGKVERFHRNLFNQSLTTRLQWSKDPKVEPHMLPQGSLSWTLQHSIFILNNYLVHFLGKTSHFENYPLQCAGFGECVLGERPQHPDAEATSEKTTSRASRHLAWAWSHHQWAHPCAISIMGIQVSTDHSCTSWTRPQPPEGHLLASAQWWHRLQDPYPLIKGVEVHPLN